MHLATRNHRRLLFPVIALTILMLSAISWRIGNPPIHPRQEILLNTIDVKLARGSYYSAYTSVRKAEALNPDNVQIQALKELFHVLGYPKREDLSPEESLARYQQTILQQPESPYLKVLGAELYLKTGNPSLAIQISDTVSQEFPDIAQSWYVNGLASLDVANYEKAHKSLEKAASLVGKRRYTLLLAEVCYFLGKFECAAEQYKASSISTRTSLSGKFGYLRSILQLGKFDTVTEYGTQLRQYVVNKPGRVENKNLTPKFVLGDHTLRTESGVPAIELIRLIDEMLTLQHFDEKKLSKDHCRQSYNTDNVVDTILLHDCLALAT